jgi:hypothetical protein
MRDHEDHPLHVVGFREGDRFNLDAIGLPHGFF